MLTNPPSVFLYCTTYNFTKIRFQLYFQAWRVLRVLRCPDPAWWTDWDWDVHSPQFLRGFSQGKSRVAMWYLIFRYHEADIMIDKPGPDARGRGELSSWWSDHPIHKMSTSNITKYQYHVIFLKLSKIIMCSCVCSIVPYFTVFLKNLFR